VAVSETEWTANTSLLAKEHGLIEHLH